MVASCWLEDAPTTAGDELLTPQGRQITGAVPGLRMVTIGMVLAGVGANLGFVCANIDWAAHLAVGAYVMGGLGIAATFGFGARELAHHLAVRRELRTLGHSVDSYIGRYERPSSTSRT